jgi:hypothetical protein
VYADKPWALSPAVATMNYLSIRPEAGAEEAAALSADLAAAPGVVNFINEDALAAVQTAENPVPEDKTHDAATRRKYFGSKEGRSFPLEGEVGMEFANGVLGEFRATCGAASPISDLRSLVTRRQGRVPGPFYKEVAWEGLRD